MPKPASTWSRSHAKGSWTLDATPEELVDFSPFWIGQLKHGVPRSFHGSTRGRLLPTGLPRPDLLNIYSNVVGRVTPRLLCFTTLALWGCAEPAPVPPTADLDADDPPREVVESVGAAYQRGFTFLSGDSVIVSWVSDARSQPGGVLRRHRGWLHRVGEWDAFVDVRWESPPTREPWRLVPHGAVRLVVGQGGGLDRLVFDDPPRSLDLQLGESLAEWAGPRGQGVRVAEARLSLPDQVLRGKVADVTRSWRSGEEEPGDWIFLVSGDSLQMVLEESKIGLPYRAWVRWDFRDMQWPRVAVDWSETRPFEPARRDVPSHWIITTPDGDLSADLEVLSSKLEPGVGDGPLLPVDGLFQVQGTVTLEGRHTLPVYGLVRHRQS